MVPLPFGISGKYTEPKLIRIPRGRICPRCQKDKSPSEFYGKTHPYCKQCTVKYRIKLSEKTEISRRGRHKHTPGDPMSHLTLSGRIQHVLKTIKREFPNRWFIAKDLTRYINRHRQTCLDYLKQLNGAGYLECDKDRIPFQYRLVQD